MEETFTEVQEISLEKTIENKLVHNNVTAQILGALKQKYGDLKLKALDDKESYLELKSAAKDCAKVRTLTTKLCKEGREQAVKEQKLWVAKEKEIIAQVSIVEDALDSEIAKFDNEVDRKVAEEKNRQEEAYINRQATLTKMGAIYQDGCFVLGETSFEAELVKGASQDVWDDAVVPKFKEEFNKIEAVKIEEQRLKDEADTERKCQQEELAKQQREFEEKQAAFQRQQDESERLQREKLQAEETEKQRQVQELQKQRFELMYPVNPTGADMSMPTLWVLSESDFQEKLATKKIEFKKAQEEKQAAIEANAAQKERERIEEEQRLSEIKKQQEEAKKAEELAQAKDKDKWNEFVIKLGVVPIFEMRSGQYRKKMQIAKEKIDEILNL